MLLEPFEYNMIGVPAFCFAKGGAERFQRELTAVFNAHGIPNDHARMSTVSHNIADEFDFVLYPEAGSDVNATTFHFIVYTYEGYLIAEIPLHMHDYAHDIAAIVARDFLQVELQVTPVTRYGESSATFTIEGTYMWMTEKWPRVSEQIRKIENVLDHPNMVTPDRWEIFLPGIMPKNQILPYIEPHHVRQIHLVLQEFRRKGDHREYKLRQEIFYPYDKFLGNLLMAKVLSFLPAKFKAHLGSLYRELMQLGANFHSVEASMCVLDHRFMTRCGSHQSKWEEQYKRRYDEFVDALKDIAGYVKEHDENALCKRKGSGIRATSTELTQEDVAKDFGVRRQTVGKWEDGQTVDGPENTSNPYHYYRSLRLDPNLRGAYTQLANSVRAYRSAKADAKKRGERFRVTFERFNERFLRHNKTL